MTECGGHSARPMMRDLTIYQDGKPSPWSKIASKRLWG
jgi:hypothetical protein